MSSKTHMDYFSRGFERAVAKALEQRRINEQANQTKQDSKIFVKQISEITTKPVITKRMSDEEYQTSLLSQMKARLKARQQTDSKSVTQPN